LNLCVQNNLSVRKLSDVINEKAFDRLSYTDKKNIKLNGINDNKHSLNDMILNPIIVNVKSGDDISEKALKKYILKELEHFFLQLGSGFALVGTEYKLNYLDKIFYVDILLFNINLNSYIVVGLKVNKSNYKDINQVILYKDIVDKTLKKEFHGKTIAVLISKYNDKFILEYVSDKELFFNYL